MYIIALSKYVNGVLMKYMVMSLYFNTFKIANNNQSYIIIATANIKQRIFCTAQKVLLVSSPVNTFCFLTFRKSYFVWWQGRQCHILASLGTGDTNMWPTRGCTFGSTLLKSYIRVLWVGKFKSKHIGTHLPPPMFPSQANTLIIFHPV